MILLGVISVALHLSRCLSLPDVIVSVLLPPCVGNLVLAHEFQHKVLRLVVSHKLHTTQSHGRQRKKCTELTQFLH